MTHLPERLTTSLAGRYTFERELGRGGMGTVYLAFDVKNRRKVALKVLKPALSAAIDRARFLREINIVAGLRHPHILPLHDSDDADGSLYYVMPYVEGESLRGRLDRVHQLPIHEAIRIALEVADALSYAHMRGVVHRDIKPANIMLEANHAVVADFGIALLADALPSDRLTETGQSPGTPIYMSPEQFRADKTLDGRTDIYSLGCVLYEMLCGDPPYTGASYQTIYARKLFEPVPRICILRETVTETLERITHQALAKSAADRFQSAAEFAQALEVAAQEQQRGSTATPRADARDSNQGIAAERLAGRDLHSASAEPVADPWARSLGAAGITLAMLTVIGILTVTVYDIKLRIPVAFTPTRFDFPILGARALIPGVVSAILVLAGYQALRYALRLLGLGVRRAAPGTPSLDSWQQHWSHRWHDYWRSTNPTTATEICFAGSIVATLIVLGGFGKIFTALWGPDPELLSCTSRSAHLNWTWAMSALITGMAIAWRRVLRYLKARRASSESIALARRGGFAWLLILLLVMTAPWFVVWHNERPRVLMNGERAYILVERDEDLVIYRADQRVTEHYRDAQPPGLVRLHTVGNVFEPKGGCP